MARTAWGKKKSSRLYSSMPSSREMSKLVLMGCSDRKQYWGGPIGGLSLGSVSDSQNESRKVSQV